MSDVKVTELRQNLPAYLERARRGELIRVTSRGEVIAEIAAPKATKGESEVIRKWLRGLVMNYESPEDPAHSEQEWAINR
jgi:antitoxin (DNA-binding transcriptional repressor) of toxin-antitoxin stability system